MFVAIVLYMAAYVGGLGAAPALINSLAFVSVVSEQITYAQGIEKGKKITKRKIKEPK